MTQTPSFEAFRADALARGFCEVLERPWPPQAVLDTHTHDFVAEALVVQGEMWLTQGEHTRHLRPGETFRLERNEPHAERYGQAGATYWVARK